MDRLLTRYTAFYLAILGTLTFLVLGLATSAWWLLAALVFAALTVTGILDLRQPGMPSVATTPLSAICASFSNPYARKCVSISSKTTRPPCQIGRAHV